MVPIDKVLPIGIVERSSFVQSSKFYNFKMIRFTHLKYIKFKVFYILWLLNFMVYFFIFLFFKFFWCAPFGYLYFFLVNVIASFAYIPSSIQRQQGSNPGPLGHESSALTTRPWLLALVYPLYVLLFT